MKQKESKPDNEGLRQLRTLTRQHAAAVWEAHKAGLPLDGESALLAESMAEHPEWIGLWDSLGTLEDTEILTADGVNPLARISVDIAVKGLISPSGEEIARRAYRKLISEGVPESEAHGEIGRVLLGWWWTMAQKNTPPQKAKKLLLSFLKRLIAGETAEDIFPDQN